MANINVCSTCDALYLKHLAVSLYSMRKATPGVTITLYHLPAEGDSAAVLRVFQRTLEKHGVEVRLLEQNVSLPPELYDIYRNRKSRYITPQALYKLYLPDLLPREVGRVLYIDPDTIFTTDTSPLLEYPLQGCVIGACRDLPQDGKWSLYRLTTGYFNSGVMLIDVARWRILDVVRKAVDAACLLKGININTDQDILNIVLNGRWEPLPGRWNLQVGAERYYTASELNLNSKGLIHYSGPTKPWLFKRRAKMDRLYLETAATLDYPCARIWGRPVTDNLRRLGPRTMEKIRTVAGKFRVWAMGRAV